MLKLFSLSNSFSKEKNFSQPVFYCYYFIYGFLFLKTLKQLNQIYSTYKKYVLFILWFYLFVFFLMRFLFCFLNLVLRFLFFLFSVCISYFLSFPKKKLFFKVLCVFTKTKNKLHRSMCICFFILFISFSCQYVMSFNKKSTTLSSPFSS